MTADHTGLRVRQGRNYVTVREKPVQDQFHGTLVNPKRWELPSMGGITEATTQLGYEAVPSTDVWQITVPRKSDLRMTRISSDRYAVHVGAALIDQNNKRVAPLVQSASGKGEVVTVEAGTYKVVVSLGMPVRIGPITFQLEMVSVAAKAEALGLVQVFGTAAIRRLGLKALGLVTAGGDAAINRTTLHGEAKVSLEFGGLSRLTQYNKYTHAIGVAQVVGVGNVSAFNSPRMVAPGGDAGIWGSGKLATITWQNAPSDRRWAWFDTDGVTVVLNKAYVDLDADRYTVYARLDRIVNQLYPPPPVPQQVRGASAVVGVTGSARLSFVPAVPPTP